LEWRERPDGKESHVVLRRYDVDPSNRSDWPDQHQWFRENLEAFHRVFASRIKALKVDDIPIEPGTDG
jgi:hypothetical protein